MRPIAVIRRNQPASTSEDILSRRLRNQPASVRRSRPCLGPAGHGVTADETRSPNSTGRHQPARRRGSRSCRHARRREWQRLVCAKELIHVMDGNAEKTNTSDELQGLIDKIIGPLSTEDFGLADLMAAKDKLAIYQALGVIFPDAAAPTPQRR
jgi:hypothetical protein